MLMPIMAITAALAGGWAIALLTEVYVRSSRTVESESSKTSNGIRRISLWSFVLLLFAPLSPLRLTPVKHRI